MYQKFITMLNTIIDLGVRLHECYSRFFVTIYRYSDYQSAANTSLPTPDVPVAVSKAKVTAYPSSNVEQENQNWMLKPDQLILFIPVKSNSNYILIFFCMC